MAFVAVRGVNHYVEWVSDRQENRQENPSQNNPQHGECQRSSSPLLSPQTESDLLAQPNPGKPVMVFLHGWGGSARYWKQTAHYLSDRFDCLLYDLRGFGRSPLPRPVPASVESLGYELEGYADDLNELLTYLGLKTVSINAHSAGASIAVLFLNRYPQRVQQAILTCHGIFEYQAIAFKAFHFFGKYVVQFRPDWLAKIPFVDQMFMARFLTRPIAAQDRKEFLDDFLMADYEAALGTIYTSVSKHAAEIMPQEFKALAIPTLLISGECDQIIPARLGKNAAALSPLVQHVVMEKTGHFPMLEDEPTYCRVVDQFLNERRTERYGQSPDQPKPVAASS